MGISLQFIKIVRHDKFKLQQINNQYFKLKH